MDRKVRLRYRVSKKSQEQGFCPEMKLGKIYGQENRQKDRYKL
ncbi:MAG: hypothetical protein OP8BY_1561 [Candidatus Saccharicenans subterraneus]|uniref:Uncharacterized protein n=1 Tax=Candidatus Saccharicenans subterraneus TaxID=2508984 RepID=A0A3E2BNP6_9BACT|nr:MAG: hypothetical protein OP8BY_1561 [Candidatus Saccharicenans subterraneum]